MDIRIPADARPGRYRIPVTVESAQGSRAGEVQLEVWDFVLPRIPSLNSAFIIEKARTVQAAAELLKHRLMPAFSKNLNVGDEPWLIGEWGLKSANIGLWSKATGKQCTMAPPPSLATVRAASARYDPALRRYNYTADEIDRCPAILAPMKEWGRILHEGGVENLVTMTPVAELYDDGSGSGRSAVDIWVLLPKMYERAVRQVNEVLRKGDEVWSYNALVQDDYSPKWAIDFAPINYRIQPGFMSQSLRLTGLLYWQVDHWTDDPWRNVETYSTEGREFNGEGMLVYPGQQVGVTGVLPSMRLKWLRDGVEDYEYIEILKQRGCTEFAMKVARKVAASWRQWTQDPDVLERERRRLGASVERLVQTGGDCPNAEQ